MPNDGDDCDLTQVLQELQQNYWRFDASEKQSLVEKDLANLSWQELLRLNHLCCSEVIGSPAGQKQLGGADVNDDSESTRDLDLVFWPHVAARLASSESPFRTRHCSVWQGDAGESEAREPDHSGKLLNPSLTHFGSLEVICLDENQVPKEIAFVSFDELRGVIFARPSLFRAAKLLYDDGREDEIVWVPLLYGFSHQSSSEHYRDGRMTRFLAHMEVEGVKQSVGIGIGQQDFMVAGGDGNATLFGLGSVGEIMVALEAADPKFDQKCRARGLDPIEVRKHISGG